MNGASPIRLHAGPFRAYLAALDGCPDLEPLAGTWAAAGPSVWLDSARQHPSTGRWSLLGAAPWLTLRAHGDRIECRTSASTDVRRQHPLEALRGLLRRYRLAGRAGTLGPINRAIGLMGFLTYEMNRWIERLPEPAPSHPPAIPEMLWLGMKTVILIDHLERRAWALSLEDPHVPALLARRQAQDALDRTMAQLQASSPLAGAALAGPLRATGTREAFERSAERVLDHIRAGDIFQANLSQRFTAGWEGQAFPVYQRLRRLNPAPFACFLAWEDAAVVSCSPERLVRVQGGRIDTRPIAGTRPRGARPEDDALNSLELLLSEKERAEHIMLVDLERNDLGRVCRPGSVGVTELMGLESYSHVMHIVSDIAGALRPGTDAVDVIRAVFPGGTITGCPKVRCMEILRELEPVTRGLYTGSLGVLGFAGGVDLNIAIRTLVIQGNQVSFHVGAGIVADSDPAREYEETLAKGAALTEALRPFQTHHEERAHADTAA